MKTYKHGLFFALILVLVGLNWVLPMRKVYAQGQVDDINRLVQKLKDKNPDVRMETARTLEEMIIWDHRALERLIAALKDKSAFVRKEAARVLGGVAVREDLGEIKDARIVEPLIAALKDVDSGVRQEATRALGEIKVTRAIEPLIAVFKKDEDPDVRLWAAESLGKMGQYVSEVKRHRWGQYSVVIYEVPTESDDRSQRLQIQDRHGKVLREIQSPGGTDVKFLEMTGGGDLDLYVCAYNRGSCCLADLYFTQEGGLRNLLIFIGGIGGIRELRDLNRDGRPELIASNDVLLYFDDLSKPESPIMVMVIGWDGKQYRDQTRRYPTFARKKAQEYRKEFKKGDRGAALGYYANSLTIGEDTAARAWLLKHADKDTLKWLFSHEEELQKRIAESGDKICVSQERVLEFGYVGDSCPN